MHHVCTFAIASESVSSHPSRTDSTLSASKYPVIVSDFPLNCHAIQCYLRIQMSIAITHSHQFCMENRWKSAGTYLAMITWAQQTVFFFGFALRCSSQHWLVVWWSRVPSTQACCGKLLCTHALYPICYSCNCNRLFATYEVQSLECSLSGPCSDFLLLLFRFRYFSCAC